MGLSLVTAVLMIGPASGPAGAAPNTTVAPCALCVLGPAGNTVNGSGSSTINVTDTGTGSTMPGIVIDSSSGSGGSASCTGQAAELSGSATVTAPSTGIVGGWCQTPGATFSPAPTQVASPGVADPLASLAAPSTAGTPTTVNVSGSSCSTETVSVGSSTTTGNATIAAGVYSSIDVSGLGTCLTLDPGTYVITGMFDISGTNSVVSGDGVLLYFTCASEDGAATACPAGGSGGWLNDSGVNTKLNLSPGSTCPYSGLTIFYDRNNAEPIQLSGSATVSTISGTIYGVSSELMPSGSSVGLDSWVIVGSIGSMSGSEALNIDYNPAQNATTNCASTSSGGSPPPVSVVTESSGGTNATTVVPQTAAASSPIAGATTVHTGEPWAGSEPIQEAVLGMGLALIGLGELRRRRVRRGAAAHHRS
jgi:hypothetical protein